MRVCVCVCGCVYVRVYVKVKVEFGECVRVGKGMGGAIAVSWFGCGQYSKIHFNTL